MLRDEDILIESGRCVGGAFLRVVHLPTGISRSESPTAGRGRREVVRRFLGEIEAELAGRGLVGQIIPAHRTRGG